VEKGHGRIETRSYLQVPLAAAIDWLPSADDWQSLSSIVMVKSRREVQDKVSDERRFYISSLPLNVEAASAAIRGHWGVESMHWILDVHFNDDKSRVRKDHAPENFSVVKKWTLNLLKLEQTRKNLSLNLKRSLAAMDNRYLEKLVNCLGAKSSRRAQDS
jgi:predicted transposase YbfD/YdcC